MNTNYNSYKKFTLVNILSIIIYIIYLEIDPKITGIWLRKNSKNVYTISLKGLKDFFLYPLREYRMWYPNMWIANVFISIPIISSIIYTINEYIDR